jgi:hypothetical protein
MRIAISGPRGWKSIEKFKAEKASLVKFWISAQLDLISQNETLEAATSLQLGLDTVFASSCHAKGIPYTVFLYCKDQDKFWDEESRKTFSTLCQSAKEIIYICDGVYMEGCIRQQSEAITNWLKEGNRKLLLIQNKRLEKGQLQRKKNIPESDVAIYRM